MTIALARRSLTWHSVIDRRAAGGLLSTLLGRDGNYVNYYRRRLLRAGAVAPEGRGRLRFTHLLMRDWLRNHPSPSTYDLP